VTREEAVAAYGETGGHYFDPLDTKKSGSIQMSSLSADGEQAFKWADTNGDGTITAAERSAASTEHAAAETERKGNPKAAAKKLERKVG
jgi:hypothetical protein